MKKDRRDGTVLKPTAQNPRAVTTARITVGLEQRQLAERIGISISYMSEIEKGTRSVRPATLHAIADACNCEVAALVNPELAKGAAA